MVLSLIGFSIIITAGIILIFKSSVQKDTEHIRLVALTGDVENEILQARIYLDEIILEQDKGLLPELGQSLDSVRYDLEELNRLISGKYEKSRHLDSAFFTMHYNKILDDLSRIEVQIEKDDAAQMVADTALFNAFSRFNLNYKKLQSILPRYLLLDTIRLKREIIGVILVNFFMVLLAGFYMLRLINQLKHADRMLVRKTIEVEHRERERIAADLHDSLGSLLSGLLIHIQVLEKESEVDPELKAKLKHLNFLGNLALQSIEEVINNLNSSLLSRYGLIKSLEKITEKLNALGKTRFTVSAEKFHAELSESTELLLYRICSELVSNAIKHSSAEWAEISLCSQKKTVYMKYRDNGVGFDQKSASYEEEKSGLYNMVRRIESLEGKCMIQSEPGKGVEIDIVFQAE